MHEQVALDSPGEHAAQEHHAPAIAGPTTQHDQALVEAAVHFGQAADLIGDLQFILTLMPDNVALVDQQTRALCQSLGLAFGAYATSRERHNLLAGLPASSSN